MSAGTGPVYRRIKERGATSWRRARRIGGGDGDSVTRFFAEETRAPLTEKLLPIVTRQTARADLAARVNAVGGQAVSLGVVKGDDANIERDVTRKALDGLNFMIGEEEKKIRSDPMGTGSALLARVFGR